MQYVVITDIEVTNYNVLGTNWLVQVTPIMAINMFVHNMGLKLRKEFLGVNIIHHDYSYNAIGSNFNMYSAAALINKNDNAENKDLGLAYQPHATGNMVISLIIPTNEDIDLNDIETFLHNAKIAGGDIENYSDVLLCTKEEVVKRVKRGFLIQDKSTLIDGSDTLNSLLTNLYATDESWMSASVVGYNAISSLTSKPGIRGDYNEHMYVEPVVGLIQYTSLNSDVDLFNFWSYNWTCNNKVFLCTQSV
jgi:CRISPR-associated protein Csy2